MNSDFLYILSLGVTVYPIYQLVLYNIWFDSGDYITVISGNLCCVKESQKWNCCQMTQQFARGCRTTYPLKTVLIYPCCNAQKDKDIDDEERGCDDDFHGGCQKRWSCCKGPPDAEFCEHKYECCGKPPNSEGCETVWKCCEQLEGAEGCKERYQCCLMPGIFGLNVTTLYWRNDKSARIFTMRY